MSNLNEKSAVRVISAEENTQVTTSETETTSENSSAAVSAPVREDESSKTEVEITEKPNVPELTVEENTDTAIQDEKKLLPKEVKAGKDETLTIPSYEELKKSELYMPIVDIERLNDSQLARAAQNKLAGDMDLRTFLYCFLHFAFLENAELCKQFLVKSKSLAKCIGYIETLLREQMEYSALGYGSVGIGESKVIELAFEYLRLDDAEIAVKEAEAKALAEKKRKERAAATKNKSTAKKDKKKNEKSKSSKSEKAKPKTAKKKEKAVPDAQISLDDLLGGI